MVLKSRPVVTMAGVSRYLSFFLFENCNIIMEGSIFSILPLLFLLILGLPAIVPDFTGRLHFGMEKSVQIWGFLKESIRVVVSLMYFFLSTPVIQVPVFMVVGSGATAYLAQFGLNLIIDNLGTMLILKGTNY